MYVCRTEGEFSAGHPEGAVNIPYMNKTGSGKCLLSASQNHCSHHHCFSVLFCSVLSCQASYFISTLSIVSISVSISCLHRYQIKLSDVYSLRWFGSECFLNFLCHARAGMTKNTHFLEQVSRIFGKDDEIIVVRKLLC